LSPKQQLQKFIARFVPEVAKRARTALATMRARLPGATELVYDNAYALVIGFGPSDRASEALFSIAIYPRKVSLCFLYGAQLPDPEGLLLGNGKRVRYIRLEDDKTLERRDVRALMRAAILHAGNPFSGKRAARTIIRAVSSRQRPRRAMPT
jgi:hypothetical protein